MDPTAALNILQNHARQKQAELAQTPSQSQAETSGQSEPRCPARAAPEASISGEQQGRHTGGYRTFVRYR
jgi:hypothetical protein